jgi:hypothetical protein
MDGMEIGRLGRLNFLRKAIRIVFPQLMQILSILLLYSPGEGEYSGSSVRGKRKLGAGGTIGATASERPAACR